jgi:hypothetical protein
MRRQAVHCRPHGAGDASSPDGRRRPGTMTVPGQIKITTLRAARQGVTALAVAAALGSASLAAAGPAAAATHPAATDQVSSHPVAHAGSLAQAGTWGTAEELPGSAPLNQGNTAQISAVSCGAVGNCSVGGLYLDGQGHFQALVASESKGSWGTAQEAPGTAALNQGGVAAITQVSCPAAGNCGAGGDYVTASGHTQAFVISEKKGTWAKAKKLPGALTLNQGGMAAVSSVSCPSAGNCGVGGYYTDGSGHQQVFVADESKGTWGTAQAVPSVAALNQGGAAQIGSVSCGSAGNCSIGGYYTDKSGHQQVFVVSETNGTWGTAEEVPGSGALNADGHDLINSVSCGSAGNCVAVGQYTEISADQEAFLVDETNGTWGTAEEIPGTAELNQGGFAMAWSVSCASAGNCSAGGYYDAGSAGIQAFVADETDGTWASAAEVPGLAALNTEGQAQISSVACASAGNCSAGGYYTGYSHEQEAFVVSETDGTWGSAEEVPGTAALNRGNVAAITSVACASAGQCSAGGTYTDDIGGQQVFVVSET